MDINEYTLEHLMRERLATLRSAARQHALSAPRAPRAGLRVRLGSALIHAGQWLGAGAGDPRPSQPTHG